MARQTNDRDLTDTLAAGARWIEQALIRDGSLFSEDHRWTASLVDEVHLAFVEHPDLGDDDFMTKLKNQMKPASPAAQQLMAEMVWALLLFPSNTKARTKRRQVREIWALSAQQLSEDHPLLRDDVLNGVGSGGPGFNNYRPDEMAFLIALTRDLKQRDEQERARLMSEYDPFIRWIDAVPRKGSRQFRHMLRYFAFPDRVERISSNNDRGRILESFDVAPLRETRNWSDQQLDDALLALRKGQQIARPNDILDFYEPPLRNQWLRDRIIRTVEGEITVVVPEDAEERDDGDSASSDSGAPEARQSMLVQARLAEIGAIMGFKVWLPRADRNRIKGLASEAFHGAFVEVLPLNYDTVTLDTIEQIDVLWLSGGSIVRAFEVEHTTAIYSGLLRMADLLALQPNMDIRLHIVAPDERRDKVFREMLRPVFSLLRRGPLSRSCTFLSYDSVDSIRSLEHLPHTNETIIAAYEEKSEPDG